MTLPIPIGYLPVPFAYNFRSSSFFPRGYHSPAFDPFALVNELYPFSGVDYPMSSEGSGRGAYMKAMGLKNTIVFYRGFFCLFNVTPHTINRMRKTRRRLFYVTHYCTIIRNNQRYTVELM